MSYTEEELEQAVSRVVDGGMGLRETQRAFSNIPYGTLQRHVKTQCGKITKPGKKPVLDENIENLLVIAIKELAHVGFGLTRKEVRCFHMYIHMYFHLYVHYIQKSPTKKIFHCSTM